MVNVTNIKFTDFAFNPFPHDKLKAFADKKLNVRKMIISVFDSVENIVGKGEIACTKQFLLFPQCFQKASFLDSSKGVIVWDRVNREETMLEKGKMLVKCSLK